MMIERNTAHGKSTGVRVLCVYCKQPIHIDDLGGVRGDRGKEKWFHSSCWKAENFSHHSRHGTKSAKAAIRKYGKTIEWLGQ